MLDVIFEEIKSGSFLAPVPDDHGGASDNLPFVTLGVQLAKASVLAKLQVARHSQKGNVIFLAINGQKKRLLFTK